MKISGYTYAMTVTEKEMIFNPIRCGGPGGQNVNKVSSGIELRFDINASSLSESHKARLLAIKDSRITAEGIVVIKAQNHRTQEANKTEAIERLQALIDRTAKAPKTRVATKPTKASKKKRLAAKKQRSEIKKMRSAKEREG